MGHRGLTALAAGSLAAASTAGCGDGGFAPGAEPADSPPLSVRPAGKTFAVGDEPEGLVVDPRSGLAAVITRNPSRITIVDLDRRRVIRWAPLPATGRHLALADAGGPVLVPVEESDELVEVSLPSGRKRSIVVGDHPHDAAATAGRTFVGNEFEDTVSVIDHGRQVGTLEAPAQPGGVAAASGHVVVVGVAERTLAVYDARTLAPLGRVPAGDGPTHVVAAGDRAWVADTDGDAILGFTLRPQPTLSSTTPAPGSPYGVALDRRRRRLWVTLTATNELVSYDVSGGRPRELARYPTLAQPNSVAVDPRTGSAIVAGSAAGRLGVISAPGR
jgi:DNA-binding beta-propeller fold protein YncE